MATTLENAILITGLSKQISYCKLKSQLGRKINAKQWHVQNLIPLEDENMVQLTCETSEVCERFKNTEFSAPLQDLKIYRLLSINQIIPQRLSYNDNSIEMTTLLNLTFDCQRHIFELCTLKDQIALTKVCRSFYDLITDIWRYKYKTLHYNLFEIEFKQNLSSNEFEDFCAIVGCHVRHIIFCSIFYFPLIQKHLLDCDGNLMQKAKIFINVNLCRNLVYFENLELFEVEGKFLADFTLRELVRHCRRLRAFRLLDADTRWLRGHHLCRLTQLQELSIRDCEKFQRRNVRKICENNQLRTLNVTACEQLESAKFMEKLCTMRNFDSLHTLKMTAIADDVMLAAIFNLEHLKCLQLFWLNDFEKFEAVFFARLCESQRCCNGLISLKFANDRHLIDNESHECLSAYKYALMRETVTIHGRKWNLLGNFPSNSGSFMEILMKFLNLEEFICEYCRLLTAADLRKLPKICNRLRSIKLIGCRDVRDENLLDEWKRDCEEAGALDSCQLTIEGLIPLVVLEQLRSAPRQLLYGNRHIGAPVTRSIECNFK